MRNAFFRYSAILFFAWSFASCSYLDRLRIEKDGRYYQQGSEFPSDGRILSTRHTPDTSSGTIVGFVFERDSGKPFPWANVNVGRTQLGSLTDTLGYFLISGVPPGVYRVTCSFFAYRSAAIESVTVRDRDILTLVFHLAAERAIIAP